MKSIKVFSAVNIVKMAFEIEVDAVKQIIMADVDQVNGIVYSKINGSYGRIDPEIEGAILDFLRPSNLEGFSIPPEIIQRIADIRAGNYGVPETPKGYK